MRREVYLRRNNTRRWATGAMVRCTVHDYYANSRAKLRRDMDRLLRHICAELEEISGRSCAEVLDEIWRYYDAEILERLPYIGGDRVGGTRNLTGACCFVAMGEVLKGYGSTLDEIGHLMVVAYERMVLGIPWIARKAIARIGAHPRLLNLVFTRRDAKNRANAAANPGSFETRTVIPPEEGYDFSYHNLVCPLADFACRCGYTEYMPYLCNLDYVMFGILGAPLFREHTCFADGDYCDFKVKFHAKPMTYWPPVFSQGDGYK